MRVLGFGEGEDSCIVDGFWSPDLVQGCVEREIHYARWRLTDRFGHGCSDRAGWWASHAVKVVCAVQAVNARGLDSCSTSWMERGPRVPF